MSLINYITQIQFDIGAIALLPAECERIGITRPLIVTDLGVMEVGETGLKVLELAPGVTRDQIIAATGTELDLTAL